MWGSAFVDVISAVGAVAAVVGVIVVESFVKRVFLSGRKTLARLVASTRWPLRVTLIVAADGKARHVPAHTLAWQEPAVFAAGLACVYGYVLVKATYRTYRILRARRASVPS